MTITVKELIKALKAEEGSDVNVYNPDAEVRVATSPTTQLDILSIYDDVDNEGNHYIWIDVEPSGKEDEDVRRHQGQSSDRG